MYHESEALSQLSRLLTPQTPDDAFESVLNRGSGQHLFHMDEGLCCFLTKNNTTREASVVS